MAIDEKLISDVAPSGSAVDRLKSRNRRIRPWESLSLVNEVPKNTGGGPPGSQIPGSPPSLAETSRTVEAPVSEPRDEPARGSDNPGIIYPGDQSAGGAANNPAQKASTPPGLKNPGIPHDSKISITPSPIENVSSPGHAVPGDFMPPGVANAPPVSDPPDNESPGGVAPGTSYPRDRLRTDPAAQTNPREFNFKAFVPNDCSAMKWTERGEGELRIPHRLLEYAVKVTKNRNDLLILLCLIRFTLGFRRRECEAGHQFICAWTGITDANNVRKSLRTLIDSGLVVKSQEADFVANRGAVYQVPVVSAYQDFLAVREAGKNAVKTELSCDQKSRGQVDPGVANLEAPRQNTPGPGGAKSPKKVRSKENLNSLSGESSGELLSYLSEIKAPAKRESETDSLWELLNSYSPSETWMALQYVKKFGILGSKEPVHSPLRYLCTAMENVLPKAREYDAVQKRALATMAEMPCASPLDVAAKEQERITALKFFETELSQSDQERLLEEMIRENSVKGYCPPATVLRNWAAMRWFESREQGTPS
jgi:hypothetical protein